MLGSVKAKRHPKNVGFVGLNKTFDRVHQGWLLEEIQALGVTGCASLSSGFSYWQDFSLGVFRYNFQPQVAFSGVPQWSALGLLLFLVCINGLSAPVRVSLPVVRAI